MSLGMLLLEGNECSPSNLEPPLIEITYSPQHSAVRQPRVATGQGFKNRCSKNHELCTKMEASTDKTGLTPTFESGIPLSMSDAVPSCPEQPRAASMRPASAISACQVTRRLRGGHLPSSNYFTREGLTEDELFLIRIHQAQDLQKYICGTQPAYPPRQHLPLEYYDESLRGQACVDQSMGIDTDTGGLLDRQALLEELREDCNRSFENSVE